MNEAQSMVTEQYCFPVFWCKKNLLHSVEYTLGPRQKTKEGIMAKSEQNQGTWKLYSLRSL